MEQGIFSGRGGLGSIYVVAAGNGATSEDQCNADGYANSPCVLALQLFGFRALLTAAPVLPLSLSHVREFANRVYPCAATP